MPGVGSLAVASQLYTRMDELTDVNDKVFKAIRTLQITIIFWGKLLVGGDPLPYYS